MLWLKNNKKPNTITNKYLLKLISFFSVNILLITFFSMIFVVSVNADDGSLAINVDYLKESYEQQKDTQVSNEEDTDTITIETKTDPVETNPTEKISPEKTSVNTNNEKIKPISINNEINEEEDIINNTSENSNSTILYDLENNYLQKDNGIIIEKNLGYISTGVAVCIESDQDEISIKSIEFKTTDYYENVNYTIKKLDDKPVDILEEPMDNCTVYVYLDIKLTTNDIYMHEEEFDYIKFQFKVDKSWLENNNIDKESITLVRYDKEWNPLPTLYLYEDELFLYFEAESPGLSIYTVVGTEIVEGTQDLIIDKPAISLYHWFAIITFISIILITIVYKLKFIYKVD